MGVSKISNIFQIVLAVFFILSISSWICPNSQALDNTSFSPANHFPIPSYNSAVNFAANGSYFKAALEDDSWTFENLNINGSTTIQNFSVSAQNSNITIYSFFSSNNTRTTLRLRYWVEGNGKQFFNFGQQGNEQNAVDWTVVKTINRKNEFLTPGTDWTFSPNGTIIVKGGTGNFSIAHYNFSNINLLNSNLPFYLQQSVALVTSIVMAVVIVLAVVIALRNNKYGKKVDTSGLSNNPISKISESSKSKDKEKT